MFWERWGVDARPIIELAYLPDLRTIGART
jgi:hypothetical protein